MKLYLYRRAKKPTYTIGKLYDGVQRLCDTLEDRVRTLIDLDGDGNFDSPGEGKGRVYGHTAIPAGTYVIKMQYSPTFKRMMPYLQDVPGFKYIMIHPGGTDLDTKGCILVGENTIRGKLVNSRGWSDIINRMLTEAEERKEENVISIYED